MLSELLVLSLQWEPVGGSHSGYYQGYYSGYYQGWYLPISMLRTNPKPWLVLTHFLIPAPQALCLCDFLCAICAPTPLSIPWSKQNSNFQEFNCHYGFYCWGILVTEATLHWATCWMFVNWIFSPSVFWGHLDGDHRLQMAWWPSKFIWVRCRIRWC